MIYVSLPVHEKFDVVANQLKNFKRYLPNAVIVLHLSLEAHFSTKELDGFLKLNQVDNYLINPTQVKVKWGSIIEAHLKNIEFILALGDATRVIFHASNDMLVRQGLEDYLKDKDFLFHQREIIKDSFWWPANVAIKDIALTDWLAIYGSGALLGSQIEGSMYTIDFLKDFHRELTMRPFVLESTLHYPREEIFFSSFANAVGVKPDGLPYVFSEVHRFDKKLWSYYADLPFLLNDSHFFTKKLKKQVNDKLFDYGRYKIGIKDIEAIRKCDIKYLQDSQYMSDGNNLWRVHTVDNLFAIKRVPRRMTDKVRQYLSAE